MNMTLARDHILATTKGHRIEFKKGVPAHVPPNCVADAAAIGAVPSEGGDPDILPEPLPGPVIPQDPIERQRAIFKAFDVITAKAFRDDFTAAGVPQLLAVNRELGWDVDGKERNITWQLYRDANSINDGR